MSYEEEFQTVDMLLASNAKTRGVDAFALSLIKAERQIRKIFTYLVFQYPCFSESESRSFRDVLGKNKKVYFDGFIRGINAIYPRSVQDLIGTEYTILYEELNKSIEYRNKIFHGQLTDQHLTREDLLKKVTSIREWCKTLANEAQNDFGYDGFGRNSLRKSMQPILQTYKTSIHSLDDYGKFIQQNMERKRSDIPL